MEYPVKKENVPHFAAQIKKFELARQAKRIANKISKDIEGINGDETIDEIVNLIESPITEFLRQDDVGQKPEKLGDDIDEYLEFLIENKCDQIGLSSGFPRFDAEMSKDDHLNRIISNISGVSIGEVSTGQFAEDDEKTIRVQEAIEEIRDIPYTYVSVAGAPFETIMNTIKRWIIQDVGQDEFGRTNDCLVVYDYLKLMSSSSISNNIQEYQALGFQITNLHNLAVKFDFPCLSFVQLNRDGITKESTDAVSGSDRLIWLCTSFSIFKLKSAEELAEDGPNAGNRKLVTLKARHGAGLLDGNYINMNMIGSHSQLNELRTRDEIRSSPDDGVIEGAELPFEVEDED